MTYFAFLGLFLVIPIILLAGLNFFDAQKGKRLPAELRAWAPWAAILLHVIIALLYTTLWDNYLVATRVWWYEPDLVAGFTIGYVPIEEYTFFILQPVLAGLWLFLLARRLSPSTSRASFSGSLRIAATAAAAVIWLASVIVLLTGWGPGTYLSLELAWALPPIALQLLFGADILWRNRRLVLLTIASLTLFLSAADSLAIALGTWTINPAKSLNLLIFGQLPVEEFLFFLLTNILIVFGVVLVMAKESHARLRRLRNLYWFANSPSKQGIAD